MQRFAPPASWLPVSTFVAAIVGTILVGTPWALYGWALLSAGLMFLSLWHRSMKSANESLNVLKGYSEANWDDLPRIWSSMARDNQALEERSKKNEQQLRSILAGLNVGIVMLGSFRQIIMFNSAAQKLFGSNAQIIFKGTVSGLLNDPESQSMLDKAYKGETSVWSRERAGRILAFHATPLAMPANETGDWGSVLLVVQDITQQEALEQTRQKFISNASHELKTPVTSIRSAAENLVADGWIPPQGEPNIKIILRNIDRMVLLLDDITELSRLETGAFDLDRAAVEIEPFLTELLENAALLAKHRKVDLLLNVEPGLGSRRFTTDPLRLNQLLENLLSNAIKFSPENSSVLLSARLDGQWIVFSVRDNGPGIAPKDSPRIFERFYRTQTARGVPGTGLGLAIVKHLCRVMGGEVGFESTPGKETTFFVKLPWE